MLLLGIGPHCCNSHLRPLEYADLDDWNLLSRWWRTCPRPVWTDIVLYSWCTLAHGIKWGGDGGRGGLTCPRLQVESKQVVRQPILNSLTWNDFLPNSEEVDSLICGGRVLGTEDGFKNSSLTISIAQRSAGWLGTDVERMCSKEKEQIVVEMYNTRPSYDLENTYLWKVSLPT